MKTVMLTGATGFIGSHLAEALLGTPGIRLHLAIRRTSAQTASLAARGANLHRVTATQNLPDLKAVLDRTETVIHCAGTTRGRDFGEYHRVNVQMTRQLLDLLEERQQLIFISSLAAAGPAVDGRPLTEKDRPCPLSDYGRSKLLAEAHIHRWGRRNANNYTILRPGVVYGPREKDLFTLFRLIRHGLCPFPGCAKHRIALVHVADLVTAVLAVLASPVHGETFFVANQRTPAWTEIARSIQGTFHKDRLLIFDLPPALLIPLAGLCERIAAIGGHTVLLSRQKILEGLQPNWLCATDHIRSTLGWHPHYDLDQGMRQTAHWYLRHRWLR